MAIDRQALAKLLEIVGGNEDDVVEIVSSFLEEGPDLMAGIEESARTTDLPVMRRAAHSLKSNARDMGAIDLAKRCERIEAMAAGGTAPPASDIEQAAAEMREAIGELRSLYRLGGSA